MGKCIHPAAQLAEIMTRIYEKGLTTTSGGNLSIRDVNGDVWITPGSIDKGNLTAEDMVCIHPDGTMEGKYKPSREYPFHTKIYEIRPDVNAIVHAHPADLVAFSISGTIPNVMLYPESALECGMLGEIAYANPGTDELRDYVENAFSKGCNAAVMVNHGEITSGSDMEKAYRRFESIAHLAKIQIAATRVGKPVALTETQVNLFEKTFILEGNPASQPSNVNSNSFRVETSEKKCTEENIGRKQMREDVCKWTKRAYEHDLVNAFSGMFAERVDEEEYCVTPFRKDNRLITPEQMQSVMKPEHNLEKKDAEVICGLENVKRNGFVRFLDRVFQNNVDIGGVILANPIYFTGYAVTKAMLDSTIIMESYVLLRYVPRIPFDEFVKNPEAAADKINKAVPVTMIENYGIVSTGKTLQEAFDRMEVAENNAKTYAAAGLLGNVKALNQNRIKELDKEYHLPVGRR